MTDWKQITARIRRARTSKDPAGQLSNLYQKTRDAMVAFELAKFFETCGQNADAAKWYSAAAERFRRADWKIKAQEAAVRLGGAPGERACHSNKIQKRWNRPWRSAAKSSRQRKVQWTRQPLPGLRGKGVGGDAAGAGTVARAALLGNQQALLPRSVPWKRLCRGVDCRQLCSVKRQSLRLRE